MDYGKLDQRLVKKAKEAAAGPLGQDERLHSDATNGAREPQRYTEV